MAHRLHPKPRMSRVILAVVLLAAVGAPGKSADIQDYWYLPPLQPLADMRGEAEGGHWAGDLNCDGVINFNDINPFVLALSDPAAYSAQYPGCNVLQADANCDGVVDFADINAFVKGGYCLECPPNMPPWWCSDSGADQPGFRSVSNRVPVALKQRRSNTPALVRAEVEVRS